MSKEWKGIIIKIIIESTPSRRRMVGRPNPRLMDDMLQDDTYLKIKNWLLFEE